MKLGLIGCGFMGEAILSALLRKGILATPDVSVAEISEDRCATLNSLYGVRTSRDVADIVGGDAEYVIFAVKPQEFDAAAHRLEGRFRREQTIMSIMAGVPIERIASSLRHAAIVRVMPNTAAVIGEAISVWTATPEVDVAARAQVRAVLGAMGQEVYVDDEKYVDMATALSASGPGFVYLLLEAFIDAGVHIGFKRDTSEMLALQMFIGSVKYAEATGKHPAELRNEVTSPAGTTAAGLFVLESAGVRGAIVEAIEAAYQRSRELGT
ncbi:MAG: pyrroline-5-carboxylate reductase [Dehalococcoidia bacterium]